VHLDALVSLALRQSAAHPRVGDADRAAREQADALPALRDAKTERNFLADPRAQRDESE